jgi:hypothetical protein
MAWLARLDARAKQWPAPAFWCYQAVKAYLIVAGAIVLVGLILQRANWIASLLR